MNKLAWIRKFFTKRMSFQVIKKKNTLFEIFV